MQLPNIEAYDDGKFTALEDAVTNERERRNNLARIPESIAAQAKQYVSGGGDITDLMTALEQT